MLLMYITDRRQQYSQNALTSTALGRGFLNQYRYGKMWIESSLWTRWPDDGLAGEQVLLMYLEGNRDDLIHATARPLRFGIVRASVVAGRFGILEVELSGFPSLRVLDLLPAADSAGIVSPGPRDGQFVLEVPTCSMSETETDLEAWQDIVQNLSSAAAFNTASFVYVAGLRRVRAKAGLNLVPRDGKFTLKNGFLYELELHALVGQATADIAHTYQVRVDDRHLRIAGPVEFVFGHRYSTEYIMLEAQGRGKRESTYLIILAKDGSYGPIVRLQIEFSASYWRRTVDLGLPAIAAGSAATAGVLPIGIPLWVKISMIVIGSAGIAISSSRRK